MIEFSIPLILSGILQQLYNWADAFIIGNANEELALAAIGATSTVNLYIMVITGLSLGLSILFHKNLAVKKSLPYQNTCNFFNASGHRLCPSKNLFHRIANFYIVFGLATAVRGYLEAIGDVLYSSIAGILSLLSPILISNSLAGFFDNMIIVYAEAFSWGVLLVLYLLRMIWKKLNFRISK